MTVYTFRNPGSTTPDENLELMIVMFTILVQELQGGTYQPHEPFQIDQQVYDRLPPKLQRFFAE